MYDFIDNVAYVNNNNNQNDNNNKKENYICKTPSSG